jgi:hypothetical protein
MIWYDTRNAINYQEFQRAAFTGSWMLDEYEREGKLGGWEAMRESFTRL